MYKQEEKKGVNCKKIITFYIYTLFSKYDMIKYNDLSDTIYVRFVSYCLPGESGKVIYMEYHQSPDRMNAVFPAVLRF